MALHEKLSDHQNYHNLSRWRHECLCHGTSCQDISLKTTNENLTGGERGELTE